MTRNNQQKREANSCRELTLLDTYTPVDTAAAFDAHAKSTDNPGQTNRPLHAHRRTRT